MQEVIIDSKLAPLPLPDLERSAKAVIKLAQAVDPGQVVYSEIPATASLIHTSYLGYLEQCWDRHIGVVISPDVVWFTLLCELAGMIRTDPERYRSLFSESKDKQEISVSSGSVYVMPMDSLIRELSSRTPMDVARLTPLFGPWQSHGSKVAIMAALADAASPFYEYSMYCCGIPKVVIKGEMKDWELLTSTWRWLLEEFALSLQEKHGIWMGGVLRQLERLELNVENAADAQAALYWKKMFVLERCGSGSQTEVGGWFGEFFREKPKPGYVQNYAQHTAIVRYRSLSIQKDLVALHGPLWSQVQDGVAHFEFGQLIIEKKDQSS